MPGLRRALPDNRRLLGTLLRWDDHDRLIQLQHGRTVAHSPSASGAVLLLLFSIRIFRDVRTAASLPRVRLKRPGRARDGGYLGLVLLIRE